MFFIVVVADVVVNKAQCVCVDTFLNYHGGFILSWLVYVWEQKTDTHIHTHRWEDNNNREDPREDPERFVRLVIDGGGWEEPIDVVAQILISNSLVDSVVAVVLVTGGGGTVLHTRGATHTLQRWGLKGSKGTSHPTGIIYLVLVWIVS